MSRTERRVGRLVVSCQVVMLVYPIYEHGTGPPFYKNVHTKVVNLLIPFLKKVSLQFNQ